MRFAARFLAVLFAFLLWQGTAHGASTHKGQHFSADLLTKSASIKPGAPIDVALAITLEPGWHIYWIDPGEVGYPPRFNWTLPKGMSVGDIRHPEPKRMSVAGIASNVHEGEPILLQQLTTPANLGPGPHTLRMDLDLLVCTKSVCVPDRGSFELSMPNGSGAEDASIQAVFAKAEAAMPKPTQSPKAASPGTSWAFLSAFAAALLGGLILNLMPCVFPILSLKALTLARAGGDEREARREALGYSFGAIAVILAFGITLIALRSGGSALGWAFQLQDSRAVALMLLLVTAIAFNLAGLFELPSYSISRGKGDTGGFAYAVGTGALAALIATPCTGPFMAGALGAALALPSIGALGVFLGLGIGFVLPFLILAYWAPARRLLPKPGPWMERLRHILSIPMFLTALALAWIIGRQAGVNGMAIALAAVLVLGLGLWWLGRRALIDAVRWPVLIPIGMASLLAMNVKAMPQIASTQPKAENGIVNFTPLALGSLRDAGKPVFLYMTADWCLSCKVNEATSLANADVNAAWSKAGVTVMRGDWTNGDPAITTFLKEHDKAGVPVYYWYPAKGEPREMPQILTPSMLIELVKG